MHKGVVRAEGEFGQVVEFATVAELAAYAQGVRDGACLYGAGSCDVWTAADLADESLDGATRAALRKKLGLPDEDP